MKYFLWFIHVIKNSLVIEGRASREEYWSFYTISFLIGILLSVVQLMNGSDPLLIMSSPTFYLFSIASTILGFSVSIRRLHDINRSGYFVIFSFIPILSIFFTILMMIKGEDGPNDYGHYAEAL